MPGSLSGMVALVSRGGCTFVSKMERVKKAGATGMLLVDNRSGEANFIAVDLGFPAGMVSDLDGANLRAYLAGQGGRTTFRSSAVSDPKEIQTGRSGIITSFSSGGPTNFDHKLKPDVAAPGGQILSSTLPEFAGAPFAVFDGTSMAAPHVSGAAALLLQQHPGWSPEQVKSALMTSAQPAWGDTARTQEASVLLEGGGLIDVAAANDPKLFAEPSSLSFGFLNTDSHPARKPLLLELSDAGTGGGAWNVSIEPQSATPGATIAPATSSVTIPPGGTVDLPIVATAASTAPTGDDTGFVVFTRGSDRVRIPYYFTGHAPADRPGAARHDQGRPDSATRARARTTSTSTATRPSPSGRRRSTAASRSTRTAPSASTPFGSASTSRTRASRWSRPASTRSSSRGSSAR